MFVLPEVLTPVLGPSFVLFTGFFPPLSFSQRHPGLHFSYSNYLTVKNLPAMPENCLDPCVGKRPWRKNWEPTPVFLPGESIPWTEEPDELQSMGLQWVRHDWATNTHKEYNHILCDLGPILMTSYNLHYLFKTLPLKACCWTVKDAGILGLWRRGIPSQASDEAWSLRPFMW